MSRVAKNWQRFASRLLLALGWLIVLAHAAGNVYVGLRAPTLVLGPDLYFLVLAVAGLIRGWGLAVQFTLAGWCLTQYWRVFGSVASDHMEVVWQDLIDPAICAGVGLLLGGALEFVGWQIKKLWAGAQASAPVVHEARDAANGE
jgi:hypothetical protein